MNSDRPKVALILDKMIPAGTQRHVLHLVKGLSDRLCFHVISLEGWGEWESELAQYPVVSHHFPMHRIYDLSGWQVYRQLIHTLKTIRPVGVETFMFTAHVMGSFAAHAAGKIPVISSRREKVLWRKPSHFFMRRKANRYCQLHIANSLAVKEDVITQEGVPADVIRHIGNGLELPDDNTLTTVSLDPHKVHVAVVAALKPVKQHHLLIEAVSQVKDQCPDLVMHFFGSGSLEAELKQLSLDKGLKESIVFHGRVSHLLNELPAFDFAVLPSKSEGFSNSLLETLGSGLPSVAFDVDGNSETVQHDVTGFLIEPQNVKELGRAIVKLAHDKNLRSRMGEAASREIRDNFSLRKMCELKYNCYQEVFKC